MLLKIIVISLFIWSSEFLNLAKNLKITARKVGRVLHHMPEGKVEHNKTAAYFGTEGCISC